MRWQRTTAAHSATGILAASALFACGTTDSLAPVFSDAAAIDGGVTDARPSDSAVPPTEAGVGPGGPDAATGDATQGGTADAISQAEAGANAADATGTIDADAASGATADAASPEAAPIEAGTDAPVAPTCNAVVNAAQAVQVTVSGGTAPPAAGGPLFGGTYFLTAATSYGGSVACSALSLKETAVVTTATATTGALDLVGAVSLVGTQQTTHDDYTASGSTLTLEPTCPLLDGGVTQLLYTATASQVELTLPPSTAPGCGTLVEVFTRQ